MPGARSRELSPGPSGGAPRPVLPGGTVDVCRLRVALPETAWIARFSCEHPDITIEVLSRLDIDPQRSLTEIRLRTVLPGPWEDELLALPQVEAVERLEGAPSATHFRVVHRTSEFIPIFRELQLMRRFPFAIQDGEATWVVVATATKVRRLLRQLQKQGVTTRLESVHPAAPGAAPGDLTARQAELLQRAMAAGYFEVPRKITLTELAKQLGLAPSSLSEALAIVEKKLLERWPPSGAP